MEINSNISALEAEMQWFRKVLDVRMKLYFGETCEYKSIYDIPAPDIRYGNSVYERVINNFAFSRAERLVIILGLIPYMMPHLLDVFFTKNKLYDREFTEFGGTVSDNFRGFLPTGETGLFVVAGNDLNLRVRVMAFFKEDHPFKKYNILSLEHQDQKDTFISGIIKITEEYLSYLIHGKAFKPRYTSKFPAKLLSTKLDWEDLVFEESVSMEVQNIILWLENNDKIMDEWGLSKFLKPGYRILFYGPPGTGKSLTASLIGKYAKRDVYRIDLSQVVSKYIGETEKNLSSIFDIAEHKRWILFFDEADALFGKRAQNVSSSNEQHGNQQVAYLLQRIEDFDGVIILATNLKDNIDSAFQRRFQSMIYFAKPTPTQRLSLWENAFSNLKLAEDVDLGEISQKYDLAGGAIINVLRYCALMAVKNKKNEVTLNTLLMGIKKEYGKEGVSI